MHSHKVEQARPPLVGGLFHRRIRLRADEFVVKEAGSRFATLWGLALGRLILTNQRILCCPLLLASLSRGKSIELGDVTDAGVLRESTTFVPGSWYVRTSGTAHEIESLRDFWGGASPDEWVAAVRSAAKRSSD